MVRKLQLNKHSSIFSIGLPKFAFRSFENKGRKIYYKEGVRVFKVLKIEKTFPSITRDQPNQTFPIVHK